MARDLLEAHDMLGNQQVSDYLPRAPRDLLAGGQNKEPLGESLLYAIPRVAEDVGKAGLGFLQNIPNYFETAKTEYPGFYKTLQENPAHLAGQAIAGLGEGANKLTQMPLNLAKYGEERLNLVPSAVREAIGAISPKDISQDIQSVFGEPKYPGEKMVRGVLSDLPELYGAGKVAGALNPARYSSKNMLNKVSESIIKPHDMLANRAEKSFKYVSQEVNQRNVPNVPVNPQEISSLSEYFPKTKAAKNLLNKAESGDYNSIRKVQSDLYERAKNNLASDFEADRLRGAEMLEKRQDINKSVSDNLRNTGNEDLANILDSAISDYRTLQQMYYNPEMNSAIVKMVDPKLRKIPSNLVNVVNEQSLPMQTLRENHPGLQSAINNYDRTQLIKSMLGKASPYGLGALTGAGLVGLYNNNRNQ